MHLQQIISVIETFAPPRYQESYDNSGLQIGDREDDIKAALLTLDVTEEVLDEAISNSCNLIIAHHPLIFSGIKQLSGRNYVERIVKKAIKNDINIYAAHTNLDNMRHGVNVKIAEKLGLINTAILSPKSETLLKLYTYAPANVADTIRKALWDAGAGAIGLYNECSFNMEGKGTFKATEGANPAIGVAGGARVEVNEVKIEVLVPVHLKDRVLKALFANHPYEEVAYELIAIENANQEIGAGMTGELPVPVSESDFLALLKKQMKSECIRHTALGGKKISKVAVCGGSGSFLLKDAIAAKADIFVTADYKYHQFFDAEGKIIIADIGHYESEQYTVEIFKELLSKKIPNFATLLSNTSTNPVKYFY